MTQNLCNYAFIRAGLLLVGIAVFSAHGETFSLIQNGNFESGLDGWKPVSTYFGNLSDSCGMAFALQTTGAACGGDLPSPDGGGSAVYASGSLAVNSSLPSSGLGAARQYHFYLVQDISMAIPVGLTSASLTFSATAFAQTIGSTWTGNPSEIDIFDLTDPSQRPYNCIVDNFGTGSNDFIGFNQSIPWTNFSCNGRPGDQSFLSELKVFEGHFIRVGLGQMVQTDNSIGLLGATESVGYDNIALNLSTDPVDTPPPPPPPSDAPEPASLGLFTAGIAVLMLLSRNNLSSRGRK